MSRRVTQVSATDLCMQRTDKDHIVVRVGTMQVFVMKAHLMIPFIVNIGGMAKNAADVAMEPRGMLGSNHSPN